jgi:hypothetical protein
MRIRVTWLSTKLLTVGSELTNVFGRTIGKIVAAENLGGSYRIEATLDEDLPLEVILNSRTNAPRQQS